MGSVLGQQYSLEHTVSVLYGVGLMIVLGRVVGPEDLKNPSIELQSVMICCVILSSSFLPSFNSIHDTLQEIWAIENSTT